MLALINLESMTARTPRYRDGTLYASDRGAKGRRAAGRTLSLPRKLCCSVSSRIIMYDTGKF